MPRNIVSSRGGISPGGGYGSRPSGGGGGGGLLWRDWNPR